MTLSDALPVARSAAVDGAMVREAASPTPRVVSILRVVVDALIALLVPAQRPARRERRRFPRPRTLSQHVNLYA
ncbi:MAG: hypothetical protein EXQ85_02905 [Alphaproteobacteria bacterium]|nr:hypothetical protein [Alphaproteobacteria bacterium]